MSPSCSISLSLVIFLFHVFVCGLPFIRSIQFKCNATGLNETKVGLVIVNSERRIKKNYNIYIYDDQVLFSIHTARFFFRLTRSNRPTLGSLVRRCFDWNKMKNKTKEKEEAKKENNKHTLTHSVSIYINLKNWKPSCKQNTFPCDSSISVNVCASMFMTLNMPEQRCSQHQQQQYNRVRWTLWISHTWNADNISITKNMI